jgi:ABC-type Zn uptake system ZnuABC Zn-binding protein ZnuA
LTDAVKGVLDLSGIFEQAKKSGVKHFFLEKDNTPDLIQTLQTSFDYLSGLAF